MLTRAAPVKSRAGIVTDPRNWMSQPGYEFWLVAGHADLITAMGSANEGLDGKGWTFTGATVTEGSAADFLSSSDNNPTCINLDTDGDNIISPRIFGSYDHALAASRFLGYMPNKLTLEVYAQNPPVSGGVKAFCGFAAATAVNVNDAGVVAAITAANTGAAWRMYGQFFPSDGGAMSSNDGNFHIFRIAIDLAANTMTGSVDSSVGSTPQSVQADAFPTSVHIRTGDNNEPWNVAWMRVFYS